MKTNRQKQATKLLHTAAGLCAVVLILIGGVVCSEAASGKPVKRIAFVLDGPEISTKGYTRLFMEELRQLLSGDYTVQFPRNLVRQGDFSITGVNQALDSVLRESRADLIIALGVLASREACLRKHLPKPVIAAMILDHEHQQVPWAKGTSGKHNLTYIEMPDTFREDLQTFSKLIPFKELVMLGGRSLFTVIPDAENGRSVRVDYLEAGMSFLEAAGSVEQTLASIPSNADAVYLLPIPEMSIQNHARLLRGLALKRLPVFSLLGHTLVRQGALAGLNKADWADRVARRTALNARKILAGQKAANLPVAISRQAHLMVNMQTARIIGIYPGFSVLTDATLINVEPDDETRELTLMGVMDEAVLVNLDLAATGRTNAAGEAIVSRARSRLYPQLNAQASGVLIDKDRAESAAAPAQQTLTGSVNLTQVLWSDQTWANLSIEQMRQLRRTLEWEKTRLDVALNAANAYLSVLLAKTQQTILLANLRLSRSNLERAKMRQALGVSGPAEVYRLESQIAQERADVMQADTQRKVAEMELNRQLAYSLEQPFQLADVGLDDPVSLLLSPQIRPYAANALALDKLKQFLVIKGLRAAPELMQFDTDIAAVRRQLLSAKRAFYAPDVTLNADASHLFEERGAGADMETAGAPDDTDWSLSLNIRLPLWEGGGRFADTRGSRETLKSLRLQRRATARRLEQRIRNAVHQAVASYTSIELLKEATQASKKNFELVADAYARGTVTLIDLLDAQTTYRRTEQNAANANYQFLLDLMALERALGGFTFFADNAQRDAWISDLQAYFSENKENE
ncbi:MAG: TolC family protein [Desulfobacteraceae bacterium]